eukprot:3269202-Amphidinium_carterae.1
MYVDGRGHAHLGHAILTGLHRLDCDTSSIMNESVFKNAVLGRRVRQSQVDEQSRLRVSFLRSIAGFFQTGFERLVYVVRRQPDDHRADVELEKSTSTKTTWEPVSLQDIVPETVNVVERAAEKLGRFTLILDEAHLILKETELNNHDLRSLVMLSKQNNKVNVVMASSEGAFPYDLQKFEGFDRRDLTRRVYASALPVEAMKQQLSDWGLVEEQAAQLVTYYGGHIVAIHAALRMAARGNSVRITDVEHVAAKIATAEGLFAKIGLALQPVNRRKLKLVARLVTHSWAPIADETAPEVADLVHNHVAFLLMAPFIGYSLPSDAYTFVTELAGRSKILVPTSRMLQIALADQLCAASWQNKDICKTPT